MLDTTTPAMTLEDLRLLAQDPDELKAVVPEQGRFGHPVVHLHRYLCVFDQESTLPELGKPVHVMITNAIYHTTPGMENVVRFLFIRVVTPDVTLIRHEGFGRHGHLALTTATAQVNGLLATLTTGRTQVRVADPTAQAGMHPTLMPGYIYVRTKDTEDWDNLSKRIRPFALPPLRAEGLISIHDLNSEYLRSVHRMQRYLVRFKK